MQKTIWTYFVLLLLSSSFYACENELDVTADWKEIAVIYGALNPTDNIQYVRIQRAYMDESRGALLFSQESDSLYFDSLVVTLDEFENGVYNRTLSLEKVVGNEIGILKDSGIFAHNKFYLYQLKDKIWASSYFKDYTYSLNVLNPYTGYQANAITIVAGQAEVTSPINPFTDQLLISTQDKHTIICKYQEGKHVKSYDMVMDLHIEEINRADTSIRREFTIPWKMFNSIETRSTDGFEDAVYLVSSASFFNLLSASLEPDPKVFRRLVNYDLYLYGIAEEFYTYVNVNQPSIGIIQKKPEYTNVNNGNGIFSSRYINKFKGRNFHPSTRRELNLSDATSDLGFVLY